MMKCPECEKHFSWDWLREEGIDPNEEFDCPHCNITLRYTEDEGSYYGAKHTTVEVVDD